MSRFSDSVLNPKIDKMLQEGNSDRIQALLDEKERYWERLNITEKRNSSARS